MKKLLFCVFTTILLLLFCFSASAAHRYENGVMTFYGSDSIKYSFMPAVPEGEKVHTIVVEEGVKYLTFGNTFGGAKKLVLPSTLESINDNLFNCVFGLCEIEVPISGKFSSRDGVLFCGNELWFYPSERPGKSYEVPADVEKIHCYAFANTRYLEEVTVNGDVGDYAFNESSIVSAYIKGCTSLGKGAFAGCTRLGYIILCEGLSSIGDYCFRDCNAASEIVVPSTVTSIGKNAFANCGTLKSITINGSPFLSENTFAACTSLETLHIEGTHWTTSPFVSTFELKDIYIGKLTGPITNLPPYSERVFYGGSEEEWKSLANCSRTVDMFYNRKGIEKITVEQVALMEGYPSGYLNDQKTTAWYVDENYVVHFYGQGKVDLGHTTSGLYKPWYSARKDSTLHFSGLEVHEGITELGNNVCSECGYDYISLPTTLNTIGNSCFNMVFCDVVTIRSDCLTSLSFLRANPGLIIMTSGVKTIPTGAFQAVWDITRITIPKSISYLGSTNFSASYTIHDHLFSNLTDVYYPGTKEEFDRIQNDWQYDNNYKNITFHFNALPFCDVYPEMWHHDYIKKLYEAEIVNGVEEFIFKPDDTLTWGQALKILTVAFERKQVAPTSSHWASGYVSHAKALGWIDGDCNPDKSITRVEFCRIAAKAKGLSDQPDTNPFSDTNDPSVLALVKAGVINGITENTFVPDRTLTRAQIAKIVALLMD